MAKAQETLHIYTRVSTEAQEEKGTSLDSQRALGIKEAEKLGFKYQIWNEGGASSHYEDFSNRPELLNLLHKIDAGQVKHIWVYNNDRLSRNEITAQTIRAKLRKNGVTLHTRDGTFDLNNAQDNLIKTILDGLAEFDNALRADRTRLGKLNRVKENFWMGGPPPYGYQIKEKRLVIHPEEAKWVEHIFAWYQTGVSTEKIKGALDKNDVPTRHRKGNWTLGSIQKILQNTHSIGHYYYTDKKSGETIKCECPAIINFTLWNKCQEIRKETLLRKGQNNRTKRFYLLRNYLYCGHCGSAMAGRVISSKSENLYYCPHKERNWVKNAPKNEDKWVRSKGCTMARSLNIAQTDDLVLKAIQETQANSNFYQHIAKSYYDFRGHQLEKEGTDLIQATKRKKESFQKELKGVLQNIADVETAKILQKQDPFVAKKVLENLNSLKDELMQNIEQTEFKIRELHDQKRVFNWLEEFKNDIALPPNSSDSQKRSYLSGLVKRIDVYYDSELNEHKLDIHFMLPLANRPVGETKSPFEYKNTSVIIKKKPIRLEESGNATPLTTQLSHGGVIRRALKQALSIYRYRYGFLR
ncbi:MAG: recombinase family protein [Alphaproteobacteria bacterium]|nr:recombinase family protein [Alphaproteobacteria bacterium]